MNYLKAFFVEIEKLTQSSMANLRTESMKFYKEAFKWMGEESIQQFCLKLKKSQIEELNIFFKENSNISMSALIKDENEENELKNNNQNTVFLDPYDISDPVDIFHKFNEHWTDKVLEQSKWTDKKSLLEEFYKDAFSKPKLAANNFYHIIPFFKKILNDNNINIVIIGIKCLGVLAKGLRKNFSTGAKIFFPILLQKFKDKKTLLVEENHKTLEKFLYSINLEDIQENIKDCLNDKVIVLKLNILIWINKYIENNKRNNKKLASIKEMAIFIARKISDDSALEVRENVLITLAKIKGNFINDFGFNFLNEFFSGVKLLKLNELVNKFSTVKEKIISEDIIKDNNNTSFSSNNNNKRKFNSFSSNITKSEKSVNSDGNSSCCFNNNKINKNNKLLININKLNQNENGKILLKKNACKNNKENSFKNNFISTEDAESIIYSNEKIYEFFNIWNIEKPWQDKITYLKEIKKIVPFIKNFEECEAFFIIIKNRLKDFKESNLGVLKQFFDFLLFFVEKDNNFFFNNKVFIILSNFIIEKLGDLKFFDSILLFLKKISVKISPKFILLNILHLFNMLDSKKNNTKIQSDLCSIFSKMLQFIGCPFFPFKEIIDFAKISIIHPQVKNQAVILIKTIYQYTGEELEQMLKDLPNQTLKNLLREFVNLKVLTMEERASKICFQNEELNLINENFCIFYFFIIIIYI